MTVLAPAQDASPADWIVESLTTFAKSVNSLVPAGFDSYVRVFHPAIREAKALRWSQIAAEHGRVAHAGMQLGGITGHRRAEGPADREFFDHPPALGTMPRELARVLAALLGGHTQTPAHCWFALWNGYGGSRERLTGVPTFRVPAREYFLCSAGVDAAVESFEGRRWQSANLWWPDDQAWCVATEIDLRSTYVGSSRAAADELLSQDELEAFEIDPTTGISWASDTVNPEPARD